MIEKLKAYLDGMFVTLPVTEEVQAAKEELLAGMVERYNDYLAEGLDAQAAYDAVIDSIGDIRELFDELGQKSSGEYSRYEYDRQAEGKGEAFNFGAVFDKISDFTSDVFSGIFSSSPAELQLVNSRTISLDEISTIDVSYITEPIEIFHSQSEQLVVNEYMNRDDASLYAEVGSANGRLSIRNGRRQNILWLRSRIEILIPASWHGSLSLSTIGGSIISRDSWVLNSMKAKSISGRIDFSSISASMIRLSTTSGSISLGFGEGTMDLHSISGSIKVENARGGGSFKTTAGSVRASFDVLSSHIDASSISGGIRLGLPEDASFELDAKSISGSINTAFDESLDYQKRSKAHGFIGSAPFIYIQVSTTSGGIHIND